MTDPSVPICTAVTPVAELLVANVRIVAGR
jgi:hypothetical protein